MAVIEIRDDNAFILFIDSEGYDQSIRKARISLRVNPKQKTLSVYDGTVKWFDIDPLKVTQPIVEDVIDLRRQLENIADTNQLDQKRSPFTTLFGRSQISQEEFIFENRFEYDEEARFWDVPSNVNGSINFTASNNSVGLSIGTTAGDILVRQTRTFFRYTAGKLQRAKFGILLAEPKPGLRQRAGQFNDQDGFFLEIDENEDFYIVRRSNASGLVIEERIPQNLWNEDRFDGFGKSREKLDPTKIQMIVFEFSWYGAGGGNIGFVVEGELFYAHHFDAGNRLINSVIGRPLLPLRYEIENITDTASASEQRLFGATVSDDGGTKQERGRIFVVRNEATRSINDNEFTPILSCRPKLTVNGIENRTSLKVVSIEITCSIQTAEYRIYHDGTLTGAVFQDGARFVEFDVAATEIATVQDDVVGGGFVSGGQQDSTIDSEAVNVRFPFTINHDATEANIVTVAVRAVSQNNGTARALIKGLTEF